MGAWTYIAPLLRRLCLARKSSMLGGRPRQAQRLDQKRGMISSRRSLFTTPLPCNRWLLDRYLSHP